jgi:hypothetical protein
LQEFTTEQLQQLVSARFQNAQLYAQDLVIYPAMLAKQLCVRGLNVLQLTDPLLKIMGRNDLFTRCSETQYQHPETDSIRPYRLSWFRQPAVAVVTATKQAAGD